MRLVLIGPPWRWFHLSPWAGMAGFWLKGDERWKDVVFTRTYEIGPIAIVFSRKGTRP